MPKKQTKHKLGFGNGTIIEKGVVMRFVVGRSTRFKVLVLVAVLAALAGIGSAAYAAIPDSGGVINGCYLRGAGVLRVIDSPTQNCTRLETPISWSQRGPQGIQGLQGIQGAKGDTGPQGIQGPKGDTGAQGLQGVPGATGLKGDKGDKGDPGPAAATAFAVVAADGTLQAGRGIVLVRLDSNTAVGPIYSVAFTANVNGCAIVVTVGTRGKSAFYADTPTGMASFQFIADDAFPAVEPGVGSAIMVSTRNATGAGAQRPFQLIALC
jgi:hypothetical protein